MQTMTSGSARLTCEACDDDSQTYEYHGEYPKKIVLCKQCYDVYMAKEMTQYWKDHIQEEKRRTGKS
jgi:hypothetical protein